MCSGISYCHAMFFGYIPRVTTDNVDELNQTRYFAEAFAICNISTSDVSFCGGPTPPASTCDHKSSLGLPVITIDFMAVILGFSILTRMMN
jgi:hypothetical protein